MADPTGQQVVFMHPTAADDEAPRQVLPAFPTVATFVDRFARRVPWYAWVMVTVVGLWWVDRRARKKHGRST